MREYVIFVLSPYLAYLGFFLGIGLISGSIVHFPGNPIRYSIIGSVGILLFITASLVDEMIIKKRHLKESGVLHVILFSVILSVGIGMISGAIQHFTDTPKYASWLIPLGIIVSLFGFLMKNQIPFTRKVLGWSFALLIGFCIPLGASLGALAQWLETPHVHGSDHH